MTIWRHWCRYCGVKCESQNLCSKDSCLNHARKVEIAKQAMAGEWVCSKEAVFAAVGDNWGNNVFTGSVSYFLKEVRLSKYDDVTAIVEKHRKAASILKVKLTNLKRNPTFSKIIKHEIIGEMSANEIAETLERKKWNLNRLYGKMGVPKDGPAPVYHGGRFDHFKGKFENVLNDIEGALENNLKYIDSTSAYPVQEPTKVPASKTYPHLTANSSDVDRANNIVRAAALQDELPCNALDRRNIFQACLVSNNPTAILEIANMFSLRKATHAAEVLHERALLLGCTIPNG